MSLLVDVCCKAGTQYGYENEEHLKYDTTYAILPFWKNVYTCLWSAQFGTFQKYRNHIKTTLGKNPKR